MPEPTSPFSSQKKMLAAVTTYTVVDNLTTHTKCKSAYIGVSGSYDFYIDGEWVPHLGTVAGSYIPVEATGARNNSDGLTPPSNAIVFYY